MAPAAHAAQRGGRRELADWVAELCLETGLTLAQAREHSLSQLQLLSDAAVRVRARSALLDSQVVFAAVAATMHKENASVFRRLQDRLEQQAFDPGR
jgi:hypothetical protein